MSKQGMAEIRVMWGDGRWSKSIAVPLGLDTIAEKATEEDVMPGPNMITWWRLGGDKVDFVVPSGGWELHDDQVWFFDADDDKATSVIRLAPGEAVMRWEEPKNADDVEFHA